MILKEKNIDFKILIFNKGLFLDFHQAQACEMDSGEEFHTI